VYVYGAIASSTILALLMDCKLVLLALFARHVKKRYPVILICATMVHGSLERQQLFVDHLVELSGLSRVGAWFLKVRSEGKRMAEAGCMLCYPAICQSRKWENRKNATLFICYTPW
jgi:hypothetical protein